MVVGSTPSAEEDLLGKVERWKLSEDIQAFVR
jgi:hypothetical protein